MTTQERPGAPPRRVLIIEDNPDGRETLRLLASLAGFAVATAEDGLQGVKKALSWRPDVVVSNIGLPLLNGYQVATALREALGETIVLIAVTAYARPEEEARALQEGFDYLMTKPADPSHLLGLMAKG